VPARPRRERAQSVAEASRLRREGLLLREIGAQMGVSAKTVHAWLSDPDGSKARERKSRYHDGVCRDCGGPCYRYWSDSRGGYTAWRCQKCERRRLHEQRTWTKRKVRAALARWADDLGRPPTAEETGLPGTRVPYRTIQREFGSFNSALEAAGLPAREPGHRAGKNGLPDRAERPWADGWLHERFYTRDRRRKPNYRLPQLELGLGYRPLTAGQQRELRAQWLAARVILHDFAERRCCSREIVINVHVNLDELISILCAAVAFSDDEHLWRLALPDGTVEGGQWARPATLAALALRPGQRFDCLLRLRRQLAVPRAAAPDPRARRARPVGACPAHRHARRPVRRLGQGARAVPPRGAVVSQRSSMWG
jgi:DNA-directed RNA polymerase subunit RPC12/RpoP